MHFLENMSSLTLRAMTGSPGQLGEIGQTDTSKLRFTYLRLKEAVKRYRVGPNVRFQAYEIARQLGVSITPVREALIRLHVEGFVELFPNRGFFAKALNETEQLGLLGFAELVVISTLRNATRPFDSLALSDPVTRVDDKDDVSFRRALAVEEVLFRIACHSGNGELVRSLLNCCERTHCVRAINLEDSHIARLTSAEIDAIASSLSLHDTEQTIDTFTSLFSGLRNRLPLLVKEGNLRASSGSGVAW